MLVLLPASMRAIALRQPALASPRGRGERHSDLRRVVVDHEREAIARRELIDSASTAARACSIRSPAIEPERSSTTTKSESTRAVLSCDLVGLHRELHAHETVPAHVHGGAVERDAEADRAPVRPRDRARRGRWCRRGQESGRDAVRQRRKAAARAQLSARHAQQQGRKQQAADHREPQDCGCAGALLSSGRVGLVVVAHRRLPLRPARACAVPLDLTDAAIPIAKAL